VRSFTFWLHATSVTARQPRVENLSPVELSIIPEGNKKAVKAHFVTDASKSRKFDYDYSATIFQELRKSD
jgi:hypothetical protein